VLYCLDQYRQLTNPRTVSPLSARLERFLKSPRLHAGPLGGRLAPWPNRLMAKSHLGASAPYLTPPPNIKALAPYPPPNIHYHLFRNGVSIRSVCSEREAVFANLGFFALKAGMNSEGAGKIRVASWPGRPEFAGYRRESPCDGQKAGLQFQPLSN